MANFYVQRFGQPDITAPIREGYQGLQSALAGVQKQQNVEREFGANEQYLKAQLLLERQKQKGEYEQRQQELSIQQMDSDVSLLDTLNKAGASPAVLNKLINERIVPNADGALDSVDITAREKEFANFYNKLWAEYRKDKNLDKFAQGLKYGLGAFPEKREKSFEAGLTEVERLREEQRMAEMGGAYQALPGAVPGAEAFIARGGKPGDIPAEKPPKIESFPPGHTYGYMRDGEWVALGRTPDKPQDKPKLAKDERERERLKNMTPAQRKAYYKRTRKDPGGYPINDKEAERLNELFMIEHGLALSPEAQEAAKQAAGYISGQHARTREGAMQSPPDIPEDIMKIYTDQGYSREEIINRHRSLQQGIR